MKPSCETTMLESGAAGFSLRASPKSMSLGTGSPPSGPSVTRMFCGLRSRWMMFCECTACTASHTFSMRRRRPSGPILAASQYAASGLPGTNSMTRYGASPSNCRSMNCATNGWRSRASAFDSACANRATRSGRTRSARMNLMATCCAGDLRSARHTSPKALFDPLSSRSIST